MSGGRYVSRHGRQTSIAAVDCRPFTRTFPRTRPYTGHNQRRSRQQHRQDDVTRRHDTPRDFRSVEGGFTSLLELTRLYTVPLNKKSTYKTPRTADSADKQVLTNNLEDVAGFLLAIDRSGSI